ncbi:hypothetical protein [Candidatus Poriferisodalis sp.]|uniref:hypothetical protein n=1 Tax=Candidatus Poriferisodalis sp. TaxID=3101277 RepID=UPI003B523AA1
MLPEWLDADRLSIALVGGIASLVVAAIVALRLIRRLVLAVLISVVLVGAAAMLAVQWSGLRDCQETCSCDVFGRTVQVPENPLCGPDRINLDRIELGRDNSGRPNVDLGFG